MDIDGKAVIVTGGSSGIGNAIAARFVEEGADVLIGDIAEDRGQDAADEIGCAFRRCDVSRYEDVKALVETAVEEFGQLDVMVNNAGIGAVEGIEDMDLEDYHDIVSVDLDGVVYGCKAAAPHLKEMEGCIINIASIYGLVGAVGSTAYNAAKGGVVNLTRSVADDLAEHDVRVNAICPGFVETPMTEDYLADEEVMERITGNTPLGRVAQPEEIAGVAVFLASEEASYITGVNLPVDGGWTSH